MSYQKFKISVPPATVATPATLLAETAPTVADLASVAGGTQKISVSETPSVASVARDLARHASFAAKAIQPQLDIHHCYVCKGIEAVGRMFLPVLSGIPGRPFWLHPDCWDEHIRGCDCDRQEMPQ